MRFLLPSEQQALAAFVNGELWPRIKICLADRGPEAPDVKDPSHIAAAKGHQRAAFEAAIKAIESLPFEIDETPRSPFERPAVAFTAD